MPKIINQTIWEWEFSGLSHQCSISIFERADRIVQIAIVIVIVQKKTIPPFNSIYYLYTLQFTEPLLWSYGMISFSISWLVVL